MTTETSSVTWDDLVAWAIRKHVDPEMPVLVSLLGDDGKLCVYGLTVENGRVVLHVRPE